MPDEPILREKAREAIQSGRLPTTRPSRMFGGPSAGATCAVCGDSVPPGEMEFELEFRAGSAPEGKSLRDTLERLNANPEVRRYHLHHHCFVAWEFERTQAVPPQRRPST
jgi:hypothetical protein